MAGTPVGASPASLSPVPFSAVLSTRTRRYHGAFALGDQVVRVFSSRRQSDFEPVTVTVGDGPLSLTGQLAISEARGLAQALANAVASIEQEGHRHV